MANNTPVVVEEEVIDYAIAPSNDPIAIVEVALSFSEYTQDISSTHVVTTYGDGVIVDQSGPFDNSANATAFGASFLAALSDGSIKPNPASIKG